MAEKKVVPVVVALILDESGRIYMQRRHDPESPAHDFWEFPGGGIEFGETPEQALVREVKEESGYEVQVIRLLPKIYSNVWSEVEVLLVAYECRITGGEFKTQETEVSEARFFSPEEINFEKSLPYTKEIIDLLKA